MNLVRLQTNRVKRHKQHLIYTVNFTREPISNRTCLYLPRNVFEFDKHSALHSNIFPIVPKSSFWLPMYNKIYKVREVAPVKFFIDSKREEAVFTTSVSLGKGRGQHVSNQNHAPSAGTSFWASCLSASLIGASSFEGSSLYASSFWAWSFPASTAVLLWYFPIH